MNDRKSRRIGWVLFCALVAFQVTHHGYAAMNANLTKSNFRASVCNIADMTVTFKIDESFGEPLITSNMSWRAGPNTNADCLSKITHIWLQARTQTDSLTYIKLSPTISAAGIKADTSTTESPHWSTLFCASPRDNSPCETVDNAKRLLTSNLRFETFEVTTDTLALSNIGPASQLEIPAQQASKTQPSLSLDSLLAEAIDAVVQPQVKKNAEPVVADTIVETTPTLTAEETEKILADQRAEQASDALNNVVTLIASSLAQYTTPAHNCESNRKIANWVQARGTCQLNFRSESSHNFLCGDSGKPQSVKSTNAASLNLADDLSSVSDIRVSSEGWASMSLELSDEFHSQSEGNYKSNRWYFTTDVAQLEDLQLLAGSILTLKGYCESES